MIVEVFKTNVLDEEVANKIVSDLSIYIPQAKINFDLSDCDKILRIESAAQIQVEYVTQQLIRWGYACEILEP